MIVKAFIGPFIATFFITLMVLVMQFFWLYIDDFVGKGLGASEILRFIWYQSAVLVPLALPLAVLLSSLMTFGNLGESFELVAIKSSGISLLRFMRPLFIISIFISFFAFLFSNYVIPVAWLKSRSMLRTIVYAKPAFDLREGVFYDKIGGFVIKVGKKESNDSVIRNVIVYEQSNQIQDNFIAADRGIMRITPDKKFLEFNLFDGWYYQERGDNVYSSNSSTDYVRLGFKEYTKQFDLSSFQMNLDSDSGSVSPERIYSLRQLNVAIDSMGQDNKRVRRQMTDNIYAGLQFNRFLDSVPPASTIKEIPASDSMYRKKRALSDSLFAAATRFDQLIPDSARAAVFQRAKTSVNTVVASMNSTYSLLKDKERMYRKFGNEWHRKIVLSLACLIMFLVGAPLGSIIRKGGLGTPLIGAIVFFMIFYFTSTMGEKMSKEGTLTPFSGMWLATFVLLPVGLFLIYKAMRDSQLFNKEWYYRTATRVRAAMQRFRFFRR